MEKIHFSIFIKAPAKKVWETMLNDATYREWTTVFNPTGSYFEGDWSPGSSMRFLGPDKDGTVSGMLSKIKESRPYEYISIVHLGEIIQGKEKMWTDADTHGVEAQENYTFKEVAGGTEVKIDLHTSKEFKAMFEGMWPQALEKLKELAEK